MSSCYRLSLESNAIQVFRASRCTASQKGSTKRDHSTGEALEPAFVPRCLITRMCGSQKGWKAVAAASAALPLLGCFTLRTPGSFRVLPGQPSYLVRSPDAQETPFPEVLSRYSDAGDSQGWLLHPNTELHIENAYYREGAPKHGIANYLGTEKAVYEVRATGLRRISVQSDLEQRPADQPPVQELIGPAQSRYRYYRYFFQIVFRQKAGVRGAVLLGASASGELDALSARLRTDPDAVCGGRSPHCAVFPEACTVALEMEIIVNGARRSVAWASLLNSVVKNPRKLRLLRLHDGRMTPVEVDASDPDALRLPLLPGDRIEWE